MEITTCGLIPKDGSTSVTHIFIKNNELLNHPCRAINFSCVYWKVGRTQEDDLRQFWLYFKDHLPLLEKGNIEHVQSLLSNL